MAGTLPPYGVSAVVQNVAKFLSDIGKMGTATSKTNKELGTMGSASKETTGALGGLGKTVTGLVGGVGAGVLGLSAAFYGATKAYEGWLALSVEVAKATQTRDAFDWMTKRLGAHDDLLEQMRRQSDGLITDLGLMRLTNIALSGSSGELGKALLVASGQLLGIAQAAAVLNPTLGTTEEVYARLIGAIKKGEKELLDELGIVFSAAQEQDNYARSLGKTTEELTAGERQQAFLNAVLREGATLTMQASEVQDEYLKQYQQSTVGLENFSDALKMRLPLAIIPSSRALVALNKHVAYLNELTERGIRINSRGEWMISDKVIAKSRTELEGWLGIFRQLEQPYNLYSGAIKTATENQVDLNAVIREQEAAQLAVADAAEEAARRQQEATKESMRLNQEYFDAIVSGGGSAFTKLGDYARNYALGGPMQRWLDLKLDELIKSGILDPALAKELADTYNPLRIFQDWQKGANWNPGELFDAEDFEGLTQAFAEAGMSDDVAKKWANYVAHDPKGFIRSTQDILQAKMTAPIEGAATAAGDLFVGVGEAIVSATPAWDSFWQSPVRQLVLYEEQLDRVIAKATGIGLAGQVSGPVASLGVAGAGSVTNNVGGAMTLNVSTRAPREPIIADFRMMQALANRR